MKRLIIIIVFSIVLVGCTANNIPKDFILQRDSSKGVVVVSLTYSGSCVKGVEVNFSKMNFYVPFRGKVNLRRTERELLDWGKYPKTRFTTNGTKLAFIFLT